MESAEVKEETVYGRKLYDILPSFFLAGGLAGVELVKPTFGQKREIARLRDLAFVIATEQNMNIGWRSMIGHLAEALECNDLTPESAFISHPWFWKRLGWMDENPTNAFQKYREPYGNEGAGKCGNFDDYERGYKIQGNSFVHIPLSPLTSRFTGSLLTQDCMLYFLENHKFLARELVVKRLQPHLGRDDTIYHYHYPFVAMEITRKLCLMFEVIMTRVQDTPRYPIQPDMRVMIPFDVDYRDKRKVIAYNMSSHWTYLNGKDAFKRLHVLCTLIYDGIYTQKGSTIADTYVILEDMNSFIKDAMSRSRTLEELEQVLLIELGDVYREDYSARIMAEEEAYNRGVIRRQRIADMEEAELEALRLEEWRLQKELEKEELDRIFMNMQDGQKHQPQEAEQKKNQDKGYVDDKIQDQNADANITSESKIEKSKAAESNYESKIIEAK